MGFLKAKEGKERAGSTADQKKKEVLDARLTEYSVEGTAVTGGAVDLLATKLKVDLSP